MTTNKNAILKFPTRRRTEECAPSDTELKELEDDALLALCLERDQAAWREFTRRFEPALRKQVFKVVSNALKTILDSDAVDDVIGELYVDILEADMRKLRFWHEGNRKAAITSWLTMIANGIAVEHIRRAYVRMSGKESYVDKQREADLDPNRGATWIEIESRNMREPIKKRRVRKSRDDQ